MKSPLHHSLIRHVRGAFTLEGPIQYIALAVLLLSFSSCATRPKTYAPPDAGHLKASTQRVATAVNSAHQNARKAQSSVVEATEIAKQVQKETAALKDVPVTLVAKINDLEGKLDEAQKSQAQLESDLQEADKAKAQVEQDKVEYFGAAQKLADSASEERAQRVDVEQKLHWYRMHWWGAWIVLGLGVVACILFALVKFGIIAGLKL